MKSHPKKNTLLKAAKANAATKAFKSVFFSPTQETFSPSLLFLIKLFSLPHGLTANSTDTASNVIRYEQSVCGLRAEHLRGESKPAGNIKPA